MPHTVIKAEPERKVIKIMDQILVTRMLGLLFAGCSDSPLVSDQPIYLYKQA